MKQCISLATLVAVSLVLAGCGGSSSSESRPAPVADQGALKRTSSAAELEAAIKRAYTSVQPAPALASAGTDGSSAAGFSQTYTQEPGVDEFDAVRYDGEYLYIAPRRYTGCCFIVDTTFNDGSVPGDSVRILATDPANASASLTGEIPLADDVSIQGMYVAGDRLLALTATAYYGTYGEAFAASGVWDSGSTGYLVYDVSDPASPSAVTEVTIDGVFVESRRIGDTVYLISRFAPAIEGLIGSPQSEAEAAQNDALLADLSLSDLTPTITIDGESQPLIDPANCLVSNDDEASPAGAVLTSITAIPLSNPTAFTNTCLNESTYGAYVSAAAIYFPRTLDSGDAPATRIHKLALQGGRAVYRGSGDVTGYVWRGGQADFRMNEFNGDLRVMTTTWTDDQNDRFEHRLFILRESTTETALLTVGALPNDARPTPIGKPNEQLYGVRFLGERLYAVTFEQIDPLYAIDLSDPADPSIEGELTVTGFSDFLHPVSDDLLLGLGFDGTGRIKLELFDVSALDSPLSRGSLIVGGPGSYSEAIYDRRAFAYLADVDGVDRFTIPLHLYSEQGTDAAFEAALGLYEIRDKSTPNLSSLTERGLMRPGVDEAFPWGRQNRSFLDGDAVYWIRDETVWGAFWDAPESVNGPF